NINTQNVPDESKTGGFGFDLDMSLFEEIDGVNFDILKKPIGKAKYVESSKEIAFDYEYTRSIQAEIARLRRELEKRYKEEEERLLREQEEAERQRKLQEQFDQLVAQGDTEFANANFMNSVFKYSDALDLIPGVAVVEQKLAKAKAAMEEQQKKAELEQKYAQLIKEADTDFAGKKLEEAKAKYESALALKPSEAYPQQQLNTIKRQLEEQKKQQELEKQYKDLVAKADESFNTKNYTAAVTDYQAALKLRPNEQYPAEQINKANKALEELQRKKEQEEQYQQLITSADASFGQKKYEDAIGMYTEALKIKTAEPYPTQQIEKARAAMKAQQEQEKINQQYQDLIAKADKDFGSKSYEASITGYQAASQLKPAEAYPKDQIKKAEGELEKLKAQKELNERYNQLIVEADANMNSNNYNEAIVNYRKALELKSSEAYPKEQIAEAEKALADIAAKKELEANYQKFIKEGDQAFSNKAFQDAISAYQKASGLKPNEQYPKDQIAKAQEQIKEKQEKEAEYSNLIAQADRNFTGKDFELAITNYQKALLLKPNEQYPKDQIKKAQEEIAKLQAEQAKNEEYNSLIKKGDGSFGSSDFQGAITAYQAALQIKPSEQYPKDQIAKAQAKLEEQKKQQALMDQYNNLIAAADKKFTAKEYQAAISEYQSALQLRPDEKYPKDQIAKANEALELAAAAREKKQEYDALVKAGDQSLGAKEYNPAIEKYQAALQLFPDEQYPKDQIAKAKKGLESLAEERKKNEQYQRILAQADADFTAKNYNPAIAGYNSALELKPNEQYPKDQIAKAQAALDKLAEAKEKDLAYQELVKEGDAAFGTEEYTAAVAKYQEALNIKPGEQYPKDQIKLAEEKLADLAAEKKRTEEYNKLILSADKKFDAQQLESAITDYRTALKLKPNEQYPKDQISLAQKELDKLLAAKEQEKKYANLIQQADVLYDSTLYAEAIRNYQAALQLKPGEAYPKTQIESAQKLQAQKEKEQQLKNQYSAYIEQGDAAFNKKQFKSAIAFYQDALTLVPGEKYPKDQIAKAQAELDKLQQAYDAAIQFGDEEMAKKSYLTAITSYENALGIFPDETYPKEKIEEARQKLKEEEDLKAKKQAEELLAQQKAEEEKDPTIVSFKDITSFGSVNKDSAKAAAKEPEKEVVEKNPTPKVMYKTTSEGDLDSFRKKLGENYPEGVTEEKYRESNKDIFRTIYVENGLGDEVLRVVARFGTFYFKNGSSISSYEYDRFIKAIGATTSN
ncbi:MAG: hypothetical protein ACPF8V_06760, partial [Luteibaculum sp.]